MTPRLAAAPSDQAADLARQSPRWRAINSAMAGIANAIELCDGAELPELSDRLLAIQVDALRARERE